MSEQNRNIDQSKLLQYLKKELSTSDSREVKEWLDSDPSNQIELDELQKIWIETGKLTPPPVAVNIEDAWSKLSNKISDFEETESKSKKRNISPISIILRVAAVVILMFGAYELIINTNNDQPDIQIYSSNLDLSPDTLSDGSIIALNESSKLSSPTTFIKNIRKVKLEGEAFFEIAHNAEKPFIVETEIGKIKVLGTKFNVKAYPEEDVMVSVESGLVEVYNVNPRTLDTISIQLKAGETGWIYKNGVIPQEIDILKPDAIFWLNKMLIFKKTELSKVFEILQNHYPIEVNLADSTINTMKLTATFRNEKIEDILTVIAASFDLDFDRTEGTNKYFFKKIKPIKPESE